MKYNAMQCSTMHNIKLQYNSIYNTVKITTQLTIQFTTQFTIQFTIHSLHSIHAIKYNKIQQHTVQDNVQYNSFYLYTITN